MAVDPARYALIQEVISVPKLWVAGSDMRSIWFEERQKRFPKPYTFRVSPEINGSSIEGVFIEARYKVTHVPGNRDSVSFSLIVDTARALGIDDNGPSSHTNTVGVGLPLYGMVIDHPHVNFVVPDALDGYAEPLPPLSLPELWAEFCTRINISGAPVFELPKRQTELPI